jgi:hypothetical protein
LDDLDRRRQAAQLLGKRKQRLRHKVDAFARADNLIPLFMEAIGKLCPCD